MHLKQQRSLDILQPKQRRVSKPGKWSLATQARFCQLLADQLASGFSLKQAIAFLRTVAGEFPRSLATIEQQLEQGTPLIDVLAPYLQANVYFQLRLTLAHGDLQPALQQAAQFLRLAATQRRRFQQLLMYPLGLLVSMLGLFVTLKVGILPQLQGDLAVQSIGNQGGWYGWLGLGGSCLLGLVGAWQWWHRQPRLRLATLYLRVPFVGQLVRAYYAYYLTANLSQLIRTGLSVKQMLRVLNQLPDKALLRQLAQALELKLMTGQSPLRWLRGQPYIPAQLVVFLQKGSTHAQLGRELQAYSELQYRELVARSERLLALVQPILLGVVAVMVVGAYLTLLLPMYQNLQEVYHD
ncbi:type II secretion system F family protein [Levilactobacillus brevis]|nr:type II secretion system F family protein [Levilactobacillus brevis]